MKPATDNLIADHTHIINLLDVMDRIAQHPAPGTAHLEKVVLLIQNFADGLHHHKEENLLFPLIAQKGVATENGPLGVMLHEHELGRFYVTSLKRHIESYKLGQPDALIEIRVQMGNYINLLRSHIAKENNVLFKMADQVLTDDEQKNLLDEFSKIKGSNQSEIYLKMIKELSDTY
jgi:hemerythrin-like domain-containing protein